MLRQSILAAVVAFIVFSPLAVQAAIPVVNPDGSTPTLAPILKPVMPGVVNISVKSKVRVELPPMFNDPMFRRFFGEQFGLAPDGRAPERSVQGVGSGVIVDAANGYVITNNHVIEKADEIFVVFKDKRQLRAEVVGRDDETDIAVLKIKPENLTAVPIGSSSKLEVGDFVVAIGNPFGLGHTVTSGIVSALGRSGLGIENYEDFIQTDASINPGNSGGALINLRGELIGINTAILSRTGGNVGIGFAIPIDMVQTTMKQLITHGKIERGQLGIQIQDITPELAEALGINTNQGAVIARVQPDSPAEKAGLRDGDVVTSFNSMPVDGAADLRNRVGQIRIGTTITLDILRGGKKQVIDVVVGKRDLVATGSGAPVDHPLLEGAVFVPAPVSNEDGRKPTPGVVVKEIEPGSVAERAGLEVGDLIVSCNQVPVKSPTDLAKAAAKNKAAILLNIRRGDGALFLVVR
jgi:serine protease Do/serine protease DegQ